MHKQYMNEAYTQAEKALLINEVPVGCVIVHNDTIIRRSHNLTNITNSPLAHAEIIALERVVHMKDLIVYITCEPCVMCHGILSRQECVVYYGCKNKIFGGTSVIDLNEFEYFPDIRCYKILQEFYKRENVYAPSDIRKKKNI